jgi:hypothetical protein
MYYNEYMRKTLTVRTDEALLDALERRAEIQGKTVSEVVREILSQALTERPIAARTGHLKGRLNLPVPKDQWRRKLKERNWRS